MKITWTESRTEESRISVSDDVITNYATEDGLPEQFGLREIAEAYAGSYDHNGNDETFTVAEIEDLDDGETHRFAFNGNGNFEWDTARRS
jgi:hypothetical protein